MVKRGQVLHALRLAACPAAFALVFAAASAWAKSTTGALSQFWAKTHCQAQQCRSQFWLIDRTHAENVSRSDSLNVSGGLDVHWQKSRGVTVSTDKWAVESVTYKWDGKQTVRLSRATNAAGAWVLYAPIAAVPDCETAQASPTQSQLIAPTGWDLLGRLNLALAAASSGSVVSFSSTTNSGGDVPVEMRLWLTTDAPYCSRRIVAGFGQLYIPPTATDPLLELRGGSSSYWLTLPLADIGD